MTRAYEDHRDVATATPGVERTLWRRDGDVIRTRTSDHTCGLLAGAVIEFRLRACPTVFRDGKRRGLRGRIALLDWLARKADAAGVEVMDVRVIDEGYIGAKNDAKGARYRSVDYHGVLRVIDTDRFEHAYANGIGPGKAFGFGMLIVSAEDAAL